MIEFIVDFEVFGIPQQKGSQIPFRGKNGKVFTRPANPKSTDWQRSVAQAAGRAMGDQQIVDGPVFVVAIFDMPRPNNHFGTGRNQGRLKSSAPHWVTTNPDTDKLFRTVGDALSGVVIRDDRQIALEVAGKRYTNEAAKVTVSVCRLGDGDYVDVLENLLRLRKHGTLTA